MQTQEQRIIALEKENATLHAYALDLYRATEQSFDFTRYHLCDPAVALEFQLMKNQIAALGESLHKKERELQLAQARLSESSGTTESSLSSQLQLKVDSLEAENVRLRELDGPRAVEHADKVMKLGETLNADLRGKLELANQQILELQAQVESFQEMRFSNEPLTDNKARALKSETPKNDEMTLRGNTALQGDDESTPMEQTPDSTLTKT